MKKNSFYVKESDFGVFKRKTYIYIYNLSKEDEDDIIYRDMFWFDQLNELTMTIRKNDKCLIKEIDLQYTECEITDLEEFIVLLFNSRVRD